MLSKTTTFFRCLFIIILCGVRQSTLGAVAATGLLDKSQVLNHRDYGAIDGMKIGRGNRNTK
jgi:hypothetical protein